MSVAASALPASYPPPNDQVHNQIGYGDPPNPLQGAPIHPGLSLLSSISSFGSVHILSDEQSHSRQNSASFDAPALANAPPPYEPIAELDNFASLRISDPAPRARSAAGFHSQDPNAHYNPAFRPPQRSTSTMPPAGSPHPSIQQSPISIRAPNRTTSVTYSMHSNEDHDPYARQIDPAHPNFHPQDGRPPQMVGGAYGPQPTMYPQGGPGYAPRWEAGPQRGYTVPPQPPVQEYNNLYAAASDVLGMGPPPARVAPQYMVPPPPQQPMYPQPGPSQPTSPHPSASSISVSTSSSGSFVSPTSYQTGPPSMYGPASSSAASFISVEDRDIELRPSLPRAETAVNLRTQRTRAIDLSAPPFTKQYIDEYRQRIKDDPDPEAHFQYAKYLIEAARRVGADAKDQRSVKRYRDSLIADSLKVVRRLATQGQAYDEAQFFLANCHGTGMLGLQVDHERAYHLYLQAAKQNHAAACYRVAVCNEIGAGTRKEPQRAAAFYRKAASLGDTAAMYKLGVILLRGLLGEAPNYREAVGWLNRAAEQADEENPHALHELALLHESPSGQFVAYDPGYAVKLYTKAGQLGYTHSQYKLGQLYEYGALTCPVDPKRSIAWYTRAAEKGHSEAELALSGWYLTGSEGVLKQSDSEAYLWARRAANKGLSKAEYAVGYYAEVGIGVKQDIEFAKRYYMRAAGRFIIFCSLLHSSWFSQTCSPGK